MIRQTPSFASKLRLRSPSSPLLAMLWLLCVNLTGCAVVKGIFKAGVWVGVLSVVGVLALLVYGVTKLGKRS